MVAPQSAPTAPKPPPNAGAAASGAPKSKPSLAIKETYELDEIVQDFANIRIRTNTYTDNVLVPIDQLYRQLPPTNAYLVIGGNTTSTTITQYTHPLITFFVNKGLSYLLSKDISVRVPEDRNPRVAQRDRALAEKLIRTTWQWNDEHIPGRNDFRRRAKLLMLEGGYAVQYNYLTGTDKDEVNDGYPIPYTLHSILDCVWDRDANGAVRRVIVGKRRIASELPLAWKGNHEDIEELDIYEHWDRINHGVVINGAEVVKPLTPHGYVDALGQPMCPWVIALNDPTEYIKGDTVPVSAGMTPLKTLVGRPAVEDLVPITQHLSFIMTLVRYTATQAALPEKEIKGMVRYDAPTRSYIVGGDKPQDGVSYLGNAGNVAPMLQVGEFFHTLGEMGGMADGLFNGQINAGTSGTAAQQMTSMVKSKLDEVQRTLERYLAMEGKMILALVSSNTAPSTAQMYQKKFGRPLPAKNPAASKNYTNGTPMPLSEIVTGDPNQQITSANTSGIGTVECILTPYDKLPKEQRFQMGMALLQNPNNPLAPEEVLSAFWDYDNPADAITQGRLAKMMANPQLPFSDLDGLAALVTNERDRMDPAQADQLQQQIAQTWQTAITTIVQQKLQAVSQGMMPGSSPPPGQPPGGPPGQSGPPQGGGGQSVSPGMPGGPPPGIPTGAPPPPVAPPSPVAGMTPGAPPMPPPPGAGAPMMHPMGA